MPDVRLPRVLVVEDDNELRSAYRRYFDGPRRGEFDVRAVPNAEEALDILSGEPVDVLVVDWTLPGISGASLVKAVRASARTRGIGVFMVSARASPADAIAALECGADDYLSKPFSWTMLLARLRSIARRSRLTRELRLTRRYPGLELDLDADRLRVEGRELALYPKELDLLKIFLERPDLVHSPSYLWQAVWGYESDHWEHTLHATVSSLRRKLGPRWGNRLKTHKESGYALETGTPRSP